MSLQDLTRLVRTHTTRAPRLSSSDIVGIRITEAAIARRDGRPALLDRSVAERVKNAGHGRPPAFDALYNTGRPRAAFMAQASCSKICGRQIVWKFKDALTGLDDLGASWSRIAAAAPF